MTFDDQKKAVQLLAAVSSIYTKHFLSNNMFKDQFDNGYQALVCFLESYAHERQGAAAAYPKIACKCIERIFPQKGINIIAKNTDAERAWEEYERIAREEYHLMNDDGTAKVNQKVNPLNKHRGVLNILASENIPIPNIAKHVRDRIKTGNTVEVYNFIKSIRGVGEKISSFYLRDIAYLAKIDEKTIEQLHLLQPIDTWLDQAHNILFNSEAYVKLEKKQKDILKLCEKAEVSSISFNQGAWFFGSQIAGEFNTFKKALNDFDFAKQRLDKHLEQQKEYVKVVKLSIQDLLPLT